MAGWNFRKRKTIFPGVTLNFSKSGVSTSVGPKGAKMTFGKNGTYLNTSMPGTGLYKRQKIGSGNNVRQISNGGGGETYGCMIMLIVLLFIAAIVCCVIDTTLATILFIVGILLTIISIFNYKRKNKSENMKTTKPNNKKGCLKFFVWTILIFNILILFVNIINTTKFEVDKQTEIVKNEGETTATQNDAQAITDATISDATAERLAYAFICIIIIICIIVLVKLYFGNNQLNSTYRANEIDSLKRQAIDENDPLKKKILNDHIAYLIQNDIDNRLKPLVEKYGNLVTKKAKPQWIQQLQQYGEKLNIAQEDVVKLRYDVIGELSDDEKEKYVEFCESFKVLRNSENVWNVTTEIKNTEQKSWAGLSIERKDYIFRCGGFNELNTPYEIPRITLKDNRIGIFYPRFVIITTQNDFDVMPISSISLKHYNVKFQETGTIPSDAEQLGRTYRYVNKDGGPDMRYSYNPTIPIVLYGEIEVEPFGTKFMVSNNTASTRFCSAFDNLKSVYNTTFHGGSADLENLKSIDPFFKDAARIIIISQQGSTSLIQRKLSIGYNRASRIMDQLEEAGIVGPFTGNSARKVLISDETKIEDIITNYVKRKTNDIELDDVALLKRLYDDYGVVVKKINDMAEWMKNDEKFKSVLATQQITISKEIASNDSELINILIEIDFLKCVLKLGKQLDFRSNDCLGLLLLTIALSKDLYIPYDKREVLSDSLRNSMDGVFNTFKTAIESNPEVEGGFIISHILGEVDKKKQSSYLICLHQFSTIIADIDNNITDEEQSALDYVWGKLNDNDSNNFVGTENSSYRNSTKFKNKQCSRNVADELQSLIGLQSVKKEVETLTNFIKIQQSRVEKGLKATSVSYHCVFTGNPGTGKTTVARIVANIYKKLGVLKKGHLVETDRSGLVAEYVGQTAVKTNKVIDSALDGVLFIDEAYSLVSGGQNDFGIEAISTLLKRMEDDRERLVVILAGYSNEMQTFINANPGLQSRFNRYIEFPDYSADELAQIFEFNLTKNEYTIADDAKMLLNEYLNNIVATKDERFGNARFIRNLFEKTIERQANRLAKESNITTKMLTTIVKTDLPI